MACKFLVSLQEEETQRHTGRRPGEDAGRDWSDAATAKEYQGHRELEEDGSIPP